MNIFSIFNTKQRLKGKIKKLKNKLKKEKRKKYNIKKRNEQIIFAIFYEIVGALLCLFVLFILSGGENYLKLYKELSKVIDTYDSITKNYYEDLNKKEIVDSAIRGMLENTNDTFTNYSSEKITESFKKTVVGKYKGIGASVGLDDKGNIKIVEVFENSSAEKSGLKKGDIILKVDGEDYTKKTSNDVANYIKTTKNNKIKLTILRDDKEKELTITRKTTEIPTVTSKEIKKDKNIIGYIKISTFTSVTTEQFKNHLDKLEKKNIKGLIIDVRDNSGGYLNTVTDISKIFLKKGKIIYQLSDKKGTIKIKDNTSEKRTYKIAVLINKSSASASEILAAAIKESYNGYVIGTNSYGKGTVQKAKTLSDGSMIKYTIQKWLTPKGNWINEKGVTPTNKVDYKQGKEDNQLEVAINIINKDLKK